MNKENHEKVPPLAERLNHLMKQSGVNKSGLARICGVTPQSAGKWFKSGSISKESAIRLAEAFGVSLAWLLDEDSNLNSMGMAEDYEPMALSSDEKELLKLYRRLPGSEKEAHIRSLHSMVENYDNLFKELIKNRNLEEIIKAKKDI